MTFQEISARMGIDTYPKALDALYTQAPRLPVTEEMLCCWQKELNLFGDFYDDVLRGYRDLLTKPTELAWTATACAYLQTAPCAEARKLKLPQADESPARDMMPLFLLLSRLEWALAEYIRRGFSEKTVRELMMVFQGDFRSNIRNCGRPGVNQSYYDWTMIFMHCYLLPCGGFKFDIRKNPTCAALLRNKDTGERRVLVFDVPIHRSGHRLGTAGYTDTEGAFTPTLEETETHWQGNVADNSGLVRLEKQLFAKTQWELLAGPGDDVLGIHIPRGMDIRPEAVNAAIAGITAHIRKYYPELNIRAIHCNSWMLNPTLGALIGHESKLALFSDRFCRYPALSNGKAVFNFVFGTGDNPDLQTLPEDTRLQRAIKQRYLDGGFIHAFGGYIFI